MYTVFEYSPGVPDDEFAAVVELLDANNVDYILQTRMKPFYVFASQRPWADIRVADEGQFIQARELINALQRERIAQSRAAYAAAKPALRRREIVGWIIFGLLAAGLAAVYLSLGSDQPG